jgi:hypothetical protein
MGWCMNFVIDDERLFRVAGKRGRRGGACP